MKKGHQFKITLEYLKNNKGEQMQLDPLSLEFENHDDIFNIIKMLGDKNLFDEEQQTPQFVIGLKMFADVMIKNRENPLFEEMKPAFIAFMKKLKSQ